MIKQMTGTKHSKLFAILTEGTKGEGLLHLVAEEIRGLAKETLDPSKIRGRLRRYGFLYTVDQVNDIISSITEDMIAGDSGGSVENIASGVTTGAVTIQPETIGIKKRKRKEK